MDLNTLRPEGTTAAAIAAALQRAEAAQAEAQQAITAAKARRDELLLDGAPAQLATADKLLIANRDLLERVEAIAAQLRQRLASAERAELLARLETAKVACEKAGEERAQWWVKAQPVFERLIEEGTQMDVASRDARMEWDALQRQAEKQYPDAAVPPPRVTDGEASDWDHTTTSKIDMRHYKPAPVVVQVDATREAIDARRAALAGAIPTQHVDTYHPGAARRA